MKKEYFELIKDVYGNIKRLLITALICLTISLIIGIYGTIYQTSSFEMDSENKFVIYDITEVNSKSFYQIDLEKNIIIYDGKEEIVLKDKDSKALRKIITNNIIESNKEKLTSEETDLLIQNNVKNRYKVVDKDNNEYFIRSFSELINLRDIFEDNKVEK